MPHANLRSAAQCSEEVLVFANCHVSEQAASSPAMRLSDACGPIDGWDCPEASAPDLLSGPFAAFRSLPSLLTTRLFQERSLTAAEDQVYATTLMKHAATLQRRSASRQFHHRWMGVEGTPFAEALDAKYMCTPWILSVSGEPPDDPQCGDSCGAKRYCLPCTQVFKLCSQLPALHALMSPLAAVMDVALRQWSGQVSDAWIVRDLGHGDHQCDAGCPRNPCMGV